MAVNAGCAVGVELLLDEGADSTVAVSEAYGVKQVFMHQVMVLCTCWKPCARLKGVMCTL